jgi:hypothetical protein
MAVRFASYKRAFGFCDRCAQRYDLRKLRKYYIMGKLINAKVCPECWDPDHPQNWVGIIGSQKVSNDPQALREPRPDTNRNDSCSNFAYNPVASQQVNTMLNNVRITAFTTVVPGVVIVPPLPGNAIL